MTKYQIAQAIVFQIENGGPVETDVTTAELCAAFDENDPDVVEIVERHRLASGAFRPVVDPADAGARKRAIASRALADD